MLVSAQHIAYLAAAMLFILSLRGLSTQETARRGNVFGIVGMALAVAVTCYALFAESGAAALGDSAGVLAGAIAVGALVGATVAGRVAMTSMPELVAILHSFVGAAAVLVGLASYLEPQHQGQGEVAHLVEVFAGVLIGAITFTGSVIAFLKLRATIGSRPLLLPARHALNAVALGACVVLGVLFVRAPDPAGLRWLLAMTGIALLLGVHLVMAIGGGDMPVVVSLLNSYSGWAAAAAGFMLGNDLLIITGALVGSSGAILSTIMCRAMNRSIWNVVFGGFGAPVAKGKGAEIVGKVTATDAEDVAQLLLAAKRVVIIPGYGMAVAQAQHPVKDLTGALQARGIDVKFAIHPVAGRLPGHMNVLLAEANVPYDIVKEMDEINPELEHTDVVLIIGANDIVNPSALTDETSPIYGMPVLEAWKAARVVMLKRGMSAGYAGVDNALCYNENTLMLFGDAKQSIQKLLAAVQAEAKAA